MRTRHLPAALTLLAVGLSLANVLTAQEDSGQPVHRCLGRHGEIVFSGLPCASNDAVATAAIRASNPSPASNVCPASREDLRARIAAAVTAHDANQLAGLLRWGGVDRRSADARLRALNELAQRPLLAIDATGSALSTPDQDVPRTPADEWRVRTGSNETDGVREHSFGVLAEGGCYWLTW